MMPRKRPQEDPIVSSLFMAAVTFAAMHLLIAGTRGRDALVARLGELRFRAIFSLASAVALGWLIWSYVQARQPALTVLTDWRWLGAALQFVAFAFITL